MAMQTVVQLLGDVDLYERHKGSAEVSSIDWTQEKATQILQVSSLCDDVTMSRFI